MTTEEVLKEIAQQAKELEALARKRLPIKVGSLAKRHYQDNFRKGGFVNNGLQPWQRSKRQSGTGTAAGYDTLMSERKQLFKSVEYTPSDNRVKIYNNVPYAPTHNWGETVHPTVTPKMRRFAWAKYFEATDKEISAITKSRKKVKGQAGHAIKSKAVSNIERLSSEAKMWKGLALTKKTKLSIKIPQRQFIGESKELDEKVSQLIETEVSKILHK